jgi:TPR repeat protein
VPEDLSKLDLATVQQRADAGDSVAEVELSRRYLKGTGLRKDDAQSIYWLRKAAEQGNATAQYQLGVNYRSGLAGLPFSQTQAVDWFRKAAEQGNFDAEQDLAWAYQLGQGVERDPAQANGWFEKVATHYRTVADQGDSRAQYELGRAYENGYGVPKNPSQARIWYQKSAEQGYSSAKEQLAKLDGETRLAAGLPSVPEPSAKLLEKLEQESASQSKPPVPGVIEQCNGYGLSAQLACDGLFALTDLAERAEQDTELAKEALYFKESAAARGCGLNFVYDCAEYGWAVWQAGDLEGAKRVWAAGPCKGTKLCSDIQASAERSLVDAQQLKIAQKAQQDRWDQQVAEREAKANRPLTANMDPNAIENAKNQQLGNIQARQQQIQAQQEALQQAQQQQTARSLQASMGAPRSLPVANSGTAPPPTCVDLGPGNCMPLAQYQQLQAQKNQQGVVLDTLCPASGFVPGVMTHPSPDVALGVQCKPGSVIYINGVPQFDTTGTGLGPVTRTGAGSGTNGSGNGGGPINSTDGPPEAGCIQLSSDPTNTYPVFHNTCSFAVTYFWTPFTTPPGGYAQQNGILQPGETQKGEETAVGGYRVYACQTNYLVRGPDGSPITGVVNGYRCVKP